MKKNVISMSWLPTKFCGDASKAIQMARAEIASELSPRMEPKFANVNVSIEQSSDPEDVELCWYVTVIGITYESHL